ncbi:MAG: hypothetical protein IMW89_02240 [Ktedonobacteraceae bacterium]|nr:hypothetical protein [Ktedonobacteraceae bacterium]
MGIIVAIALGMLALAFVLFPLYQRHAPVVTAYPVKAAPDSESAAGTGDAGDAAEPVEEQERAVRGALQEVEFDYQLGNIAEADYRALREQYMNRALVALKSRYRSDQEIDDEIEEQLRRLREREGHHEKDDT